MAKERYLEEDKEKGRSTSRNEDHLGNDRSFKMNKSMTRLPNQIKNPHTHSSCVAKLGDIIDANSSSYGKIYDQRVTVDHGESCLGYDSKT